MEPSVQRLKVYPNPFTDQATVELPELPKGPVTLEVFSVEGRLVQRRVYPRSRKLPLDRKGMQGGMYLFRIQADGTMLGSGRLMVR